MATIESRARCTSRSTVQSSTATPTTGQSSRPRSSSRYSDRNVITRARSPVIPNTTSTSAARGTSSSCTEGIASAVLLAIAASRAPSFGVGAFLSPPPNPRRVGRPHPLRMMAAPERRRDDGSMTS